MVLVAPVLLPALVRVCWGGLLICRGEVCGLRSDPLPPPPPPPPHVQGRGRLPAPPIQTARPLAGSTAAVLELPPAAPPPDDGGHRLQARARWPSLAPPRRRRRRRRPAGAGSSSATPAAASPVIIRSGRSGAPCASYPVRRRFALTARCLPMRDACPPRPGARARARAGKPSPWRQQPDASPAWLPRRVVEYLFGPLSRFLESHLPGNSNDSRSRGRHQPASGCFLWSRFRQRRLTTRTPPSGPECVRRSGRSRPGRHLIACRCCCQPTWDQERR